MAFDPDKYLAAKAQPAAGGFNPDAYLADKSGGAQEFDTVVQEMHPDISTVDRLGLKNFSQDDQGQVDFLKNKGFDSKLSSTGQVLVRKPGEQAYKVLDPDNGALETIGGLLALRPEAWRDLGDIGYDAVSGLGTGAATGAAGVAGAAAGGVGAIPAAVAAGAGSSAAFEGLRQLAGNYLGYAKGADLGNLAAATIAGGVSPMLLGTGASSKAIAKAGIDAASQRGALGLVRDNIAKPALAKVGGVLSGTSSSSLNTLAKHFPKFEKTVKNPEGVLDLIEEAGKDTSKAFAKAKTTAWNEFQSALGEYGDEATVDLAPLKARWQQAIQMAEEKARSGTDADQELLSRLSGAYNHFLKSNVPEVTPGGVTRTFDALGNAVEVPVPSATKIVRKDLERLSPKQAVELERKLGELADFQNIDNRAVTQTNRLSGQSADDMALKTIAADLKRTLGESVEAVLPENAIPAKRRYGQLKDLEADVEALTKNPRMAFTNLRNADVSSNITNLQQFRKIDRLVGTRLEDAAKFAETIDLFGPGRKSWFHGGVGKNIPAAAAGGLLGAYAGRRGGEGSGYTGGIVGMGTGLLLGGPGAMRNYVKYGIKAGNLNKALAPLRVGAGKEIIEDSPWLQMRRSGN